MKTMTRERESTAPAKRLLLAFELGQRTWKLGFSADGGQRPRIRQIPAACPASRSWRPSATSDGPVGTPVPRGVGGHRR